MPYPWRFPEQASTAAGVTWERAWAELPACRGCQAGHRAGRPDPSPAGHLPGTGRSTTSQVGLTPPACPPPCCAATCSRARSPSGPGLWHRPGHRWPCRRTSSILGGRGRQASRSPKFCPRILPRVARQWVGRQEGAGLLPPRAQWVSVGRGSGSLPRPWFHILLTAPPFPEGTQTFLGDEPASLFPRGFHLPAGRGGTTQVTQSAARAPGQPRWATSCPAAW